MRGAWTEPIEVELGAIGSYTVITNTEQAALVLLYDWPTDKGEAYRAAKHACLAVLEGEREPDEARAAFLAAAAEADVSIRPWQRNIPEGKPTGMRFGKRRKR